MCSSKCFFLVSNLVLMILSLIILVFSAIIQNFDSSYILFREYVCTPTSIFIIFGSCLLCISLFALFIVYVRSAFLLSVYTCILFIVSVVEVAIVLAFFVMKSHVMNLITDSLFLAESKYTIDKTAAETWDIVQRDLTCCGVNNYTEWFQYFNTSVPDSCCDFYTVGCGQVAVNNGNFYQNACASAIANWTYGHVITTAIFFSCTLFLQILSLITSHLYRTTIDSLTL